MILRNRLFAALAGASLVGAIAIGGAGVSAQESTPADQVANTVGANAVYFVSIHEGSCDDFVAASEFDIGDTRVAGHDEEGDVPEMRGATDAIPVLVADETIDSNFGHVLDDVNHVVAVHASSEDYGTVVACGAVGGVIEDGRLIAGIGELNGSGVEGILILDEDESGFLGLGDEEINVKVYLLSDTGEVTTEVSATPATVETGSPEPAAPADGTPSPSVDDGTPEA